MDTDERPNSRTGRHGNAEPEPSENEVNDPERERESGESGRPVETPEDCEDGVGGEAGDIECAVGSWQAIWDKFAETRMKKGSSAAWAGLQIEFAKNAATLVPTMLNGKDFVAMVSDVEERIKNESGTEKSDPMEAVASWLRGDEKEIIQ